MCYMCYWGVPMHKKYVNIGYSDGVYQIIIRVKKLEYSGRYPTIF